MKKFNRLLGLLCIMLMAQVTFSQGIGGSAHDFSTQSWSTSNKICAVCHTPHNAQNATDDIKVPTNAPLWNHNVTATLSFSLYGATNPTGTLDATISQPDGASKLCLSCHDGTVALDAFGGGAATAGLMAAYIPLRSSGTGTTGADLSFGTDLSNDHPISFTYDDALAGADGELFDPTVTTGGLGAGGKATALLGTIEEDLLFGAAGAKTMECGSCHDVHDAAGNAYLLTIDNTNSELCLTCHAK